MITRSKYSLSPIDTVRCPVCLGKRVNLLASDPIRAPAFYLCKCGWIGEVGHGPVHIPVVDSPRVDVRAEPYSIRSDAWVPREIQGQPWTLAAWLEWKRRLPPLRIDQWIMSANYYTPRPWRNEYDRGSHHYGFTYILQPGNHVCFWQWHESDRRTE